ncbi:hypothetical protein B566_EDAN017693, partial [Ephemera danica]
MAIIPQVYDGPNSNARLLLIHCGNENPNPAIINSTSNQLYLKMRAGNSSLSRTAKGFLANYTMKCGAKILTNGTGELQSSIGTDILRMLNGASNCTWIIIADQPDGHVTLTMTHIDVSFNTDNTAGCSTNYIEVRDGVGLNAPLLNTYCGTRVPPHIISQGLALTVTLVFPFSIMHHLSFAATYSVINDACGGNLTSEGGAFTTPKYPLSYPNNIECIWTINTSPGNKALVTFGLFDIEESDNCNGDYLEIRSDLTGAGPLLGVFCGNTVPNNITATATLWIKFRSDNDGTSSGFLAYYSMVHGGELAGPTGTVSNPLYPKPYIQKEEYWWRITVSFGFSVRITFKELYLDSIQCNSHISIYDGFDDTAQSLFMDCHGAQLPDPITSTTNVVYIKFKNIPLSFGSIFFVEWLQVEKSGLRLSSVTTASLIPGCGGIFTNITMETIVNFASPGYPRGYDQNLNCEWIFEAPLTYHMAFWFNTMNLESTEDCLFDYVTIYSGERDQNEANQWKKIVCGSPLQDRNGFIEVNNVTQNSRLFFDLSSCEYNITVRAGRTIQVTFEMINIPASSNPNSCGDYYVMLKNGAGPESPLLGDGSYCGQVIPIIPKTTGNKLYIKYLGSRLGTYGFKLRYEEISTSCGGRYLFTTETEYREISSPNYPRIPPLNTECEWVFIAPQGHRLRVDFIDHLDFATRPNPRRCEKAYVEFHDGSSALSTPLGRFCRDKSSSIWSTDNAIYIHYFTNVENPRTGFKVNVSIAKCGGTIVSYNGVINMPDLTDETSLYCIWRLIAPRNRILSILFESLNLPLTANCSGDDYIKLTEATYVGNEALLGKYCGNIVPTEVIDVGSDRALITLKTSRNMATRTFKLLYTSTEQKCGGNLDTPAGEITSLGYPNSQRRYCRWLIAVPKGRRIRLEFLDFDFEATHPACTQWLMNQIRNCLNKIIWISGQRMLGQFCGNYTTPQVVANPFGQTVIKAYQVEAENKVQFTLSYKVNTCGGVLEGPEEEITSPNFPQEYNASMDCAWSLQYPQGQSILIKFLTMDMEPECDHDHVMVFNGPTSQSPIIGTYCGNSLPGDIQSQSNFLFITFHSDARHQRQGFKFTAEPVLSGCGDIFYRRSGEIASTNFPQTYPNNAECEWEIRVDVGYHIGLSFTQRFHIEMSDGCKKDFVEVFDYSSDSWVSMGKVCGRNKPPSYNSTSNRMKILFRSDNQVNADGFKAQWNVNCGGLLTAHQGVIVSPSYPRNYGKSVLCNYTISAPNLVIEYEFVDFSLQQGILTDFQSGSLDCRYDNITMYRNLNRGRRSGSILQRTMTFSTMTFTYCGQEAPPAAWSLNSLSIVFQTDRWVENRGFRMIYQLANCGGEITSPTLLKNPNPYINFEDFILNCTWIITAPTNKNVLIRFQSFELESSYECNLIYIETFEGRVVNASRSLGKLCGNLTNNVPVIKSTSNQMVLTFWTLRDMFLQSCSFSAAITFTFAPSAGCGGFVNASAHGRHIIKSVTNQATAQYESLLDCHWTVEALPGFSIKFTIQDMNITHCAQWNVNCGGLLTAHQGVIVSPSYPRNYGKSVLCNYTISAPNLVIEYEFVDFSLQQGILTDFQSGSLDCRYDNITMYRNLNRGRRSGSILQRTMTFSTMTFTYCGQEAPPAAWSLNSLSIVFQTDRWVENRGFRMIYQLANCGGEITSPTLLKNPNPYINFEDFILNCTWIITAPTNKNVLIRFQSFELESSYECNLIYIETFEGRVVNASRSLGKLCGNLTNNVPVIKSTSNQMVLTFWTLRDMFLQSCSFSAAITFTFAPSAGCGGFVNASAHGRHIIKSVTNQATAQYESLLDCHWTVEALPGFSIKFTIQDMNITHCVSATSNAACA